MTEQPPNCESCDNCNEQDNVVLGEWVTVETCMGKILTATEINHTKKHGCVHHPDNKAWMMRDVVMELTNKLKALDFMTNLSSGELKLLRAYYREAITLIKGDGK